MNDFTKDELLEIKFVFEQWNYPPGKYPNDEKILNKLKVLIEDYCDHKHKIECADCEVLRCRQCIKAERK